MGLSHWRPESQLWTPIRFAGPEKLGLAPKVLKNLSSTWFLWGETFCRTFLQNPKGSAEFLGNLWVLQARLLRTGFSCRIFFVYELSMFLLLVLSPRENPGRIFYPPFWPSDNFRGGGGVFSYALNPPAAGIYTPPLLYARKNQPKNPAISPGLVNQVLAALQGSYPPLIIS